jgi:MoxR-like ATPase
VYSKVSGSIGKIMQGQAASIRKLLAALASGGHVLLEDFPAPAKPPSPKRWLAPSRLASRASNSPQICSHRTSSALSIFNQRDQQFKFHEGPIFTNVLLADEINRASPRTQSALLEAMGEAR